MGRAIDLTGQRFGSWLVIGVAGKDNRRSFKWLCRCDCGNVKEVQGVSLRMGRSTSCGCSISPDLTGKIFGGLCVIKKSEKKHKGKHGVRWLCKCECGRTTVVLTERLNSGNTRSCGCAIYSQGGLCAANESEYKCWQHMISRCSNPKDSSYPDYGARGIRVCKRWCDFSLFLTDMGSKSSDNLSIERLNVNGDYEPGNCVWATRKTQMRNTRRNFVIEYRGEKRCLSEWCELLGLTYARTLARLRCYGWTVERAFEEPKKVNQFSK